MPKVKLLINNAQQAMLSAVQIYNNPLIKFKSELFIITAIIAWTYLLHGYYKRKRVEIRKHKVIKKNKRFEKTKGGDYKYLSLEKCLNNSKSPLDNNIKNNLLFLIRIRHEIEHKMTDKIDAYMTAKFQACCLNFNDFLRSHFGSKFDIGFHQPLSLQFSNINLDQKEELSHRKLPKNILSVTRSFEKKLTQDEYNDPRYSYRVFLVKKIANHRESADDVVEYIKPGSEKEAEINRILIKETEKEKYKPAAIVALMQKEGYKKFNMHHHTILWKKKDAKKGDKKYGTKLSDGNWYWYESWVSIVRKYCQDHNDKFS